MATTPTPSTLRHQDIRYGWIFNVGRHLKAPRLAAVEEAVARARKERACVPIRGSRYQLYLATKTESDGNIGLWVSVGDEPLGGGVFSPNEQVYSARLAVQHATAPLAWRNLISEYLNDMLSADPSRLYSAPGLMPKSYPWLCGFAAPEAKKLTRDEWRELVEVVRLAGLILVTQAEASVRAAAARGFIPKADADLYLELGDW